MSDKTLPGAAHTATHDDGEIHLPPPSWGPIVLALGVVMAVGGLAMNQYWSLPMVLAGLIIFVIAVWKVGHFEVVKELRPSMNVSSRKLGMWVFLASEIVFFSGFISTFLGYKARTGQEVLDLLNVPLMTIATFVLLTSSLGAVSMLSALEEGNKKRFRNWLIATVVLGVVFLGLEFTEWLELMSHGITINTLFGSAFFTLTGFHGLHVIIGIAWMVFLAVRYGIGELGTKDALGVELFGLYWHFVDIVWIVLFTLVYLL
ncbi:MAG: heme-copper oxidase subunit III [Anaerolineae bacterium]|nr:heme-copper oxidase subunit III [Anaerolineae bacterium]